MKKLTSLFVVVFLARLPYLAQIPPYDKNWEIVLMENFTTLDTTIWHVANNYDHNGEPEMYTNRSQNVYIDDGKLVFKILREDYQDHDYTSGWVNTKTLYRYGYFEIMCKLPKGKGFFPAFWLHNGSCQYQDYNEMDIFEMDGSYPTTTTNSLHNCGTIDYLKEYTCSDYSTNYHKYSVEWTADKIVWYIDETKLRNEPNVGGYNHFLTVIANLAILPWDLPNSFTPFPSYMNTESIKIYRLKMDCNTVVNEIYNFNTFFYAVKKSISLGSPTLIPPNSIITLRATDYLQLNAGFSSTLGTEFVLYPTSCN